MANVNWGALLDADPRSRGFTRSRGLKRRHPVEVPVDWGAMLDAEQEPERQAPQRQTQPQQPIPSRKVRFEGAVYEFQGPNWSDEEIGKWFQERVVEARKQPAQQQVAPQAKPTESPEIGLAKQTYLSILNKIESGQEATKDEYDALGRAADVLDSAGVSEQSVFADRKQPVWNPPKPVESMETKQESIQDQLLNDELEKLKTTIRDRVVAGKPDKPGYAIKGIDDKEASDIATQFPLISDAGSVVKRLDRLYRIANLDLREQAGADMLLKDVPNEDRQLYLQVLSDLASNNPPQLSVAEKARVRSTRGIEKMLSGIDRTIAETLPVANASDIESENRWLNEAMRIKEGGVPASSKNWLMRGLYGAMEMAPPMIASTGMGASPAGLTGQTAFWVTQEYPGLQDELRSMGVSDKSARNAAAIAAVPISVIELWERPFNALGLGEATKAAGRQAAKRAAVEFFKSYGKEMTEEVAQAGVAYATKEMLAAIEPHVSIDRKQEWENAKNGLTDAALALPWMMGPGHAARIGGGAVSDIQRRTKEKAIAQTRATQQQAVSDFLQPPSVATWVQSHPDAAKQVAEQTSDARFSRQFKSPEWEVKNGVPERTTTEQRKTFANLVRGVLAQSSGVQEAAAPGVVPGETGIPLETGPADQGTPPTPGTEIQPVVGPTAEGTVPAGTEKPPAVKPTGPEGGDVESYLKSQDPQQVETIWRKWFQDIGENEIAPSKSEMVRQLVESGWNPETEVTNAGQISQDQAVPQGIGEVGPGSQANRGGNLREAGEDQVRTQPEGEVAPAPEVQVEPAKPWRKMHDTEPDPFQRNSILELVANSGRSASDQDLVQVLDLLEEDKVGSNAWNVAWAVAKNPVASEQTKSRAIAMREEWMRPGREEEAPPPQPPSKPAPKGVKKPAPAPATQTDLDRAIANFEAAYAAASERDRPTLEHWKGEIQTAREGDSNAIGNVIRVWKDRIPAKAGTETVPASPKPASAPTGPAGQAAPPEGVGAGVLGQETGVTAVRVAPGPSKGLKQPVPAVTEPTPSESAIPQSAIDRIEKLAFTWSQQAAKDEGGRGLAVGAENINYRWASDALRSFLRRIQSGTPVDQAATETKAEAREWIAKHNARRPKDINWQRWEGSADRYIDDAVRIIAQERGKDTKATPPVNPVATPRTWGPAEANEYEQAIVDTHRLLWDSDAYAKSDFYDYTQPIPKTGGIVAARQSARYANDPAYHDWVEDRISELTRYIVDLNRKRLILRGVNASGEFGVSYSIQPEKRRAGYTVNVSRAWNMEAKSKYPNTDKLGDVAVREALQNSLDAVLAAIEQKQIKTGTIEFEVENSKYLVRDNGIGMSEDDIAEKFLALHATGKDVQGRFGGFGIAKAVILGPSENATWVLKTRDNAFTHEMAQNQEHIQSLPEPIQGTEIYVEDQGGNQITSEQAEQYVATTEVPRNIKLTYNGKPVKNLFALRKAATKDHVQLRGNTTMEIAFYPKAPTGMEKKLVLRLVDPKTGAKLTQGIIDIYNDGFVGTLVADVTTTETPGGYEYPLTDSRMELKWHGRDAIDKIVEKHSVDPMSAKRAGVTSRTIPIASHGPWKSTVAKAQGDEGYKSVASEIEAIYNETGGYFGEHGRAFTPLNELDIKIDTGFKGYAGNSLFHAKHLAAYEAVARLFTKAAGVKPFSRFYAMLSKGVDGGIVESEYGGGGLGLNHTSVAKDALKSPLTYALYLKGLIDHELTHEFVGKHNEEFSSKREETGKKTAHLLPYVIRIAEAVTGKTSEITRTVEKTKEVKVPVEVQVEVPVEVVKEVEVPVNVPVEVIREILPPEQLELFSKRQGGAVDGQVELYLPRRAGESRQLGLFGGGTEGRTRNRNGERGGEATGGGVELTNIPSDDATRTRRMGLLPKPEGPITEPPAELTEPNKVPVEHPSKPAAQGKGEEGGEQGPRISRGTLGPSATGTSTSAASWAGTPTETKAGGKLVQSLETDKVKFGRRPRRGLRSIAEFLADQFHSAIVVTKKQLTKRYPAHFERWGALIRSKSGTWQLVLHETGHAMSAFLRDSVPGWNSSIATELEAFAATSGFASAETAEEGAAEVARRYITDPASIPNGLRTAFEDAVRSVNPELLQSLRDAHRAYVYHTNRPPLEAAEADQNDKPPKPSFVDRAADTLWGVAETLVGRSTLILRAKRLAFHLIGGDTWLTKLPGTGVLSLGKSLVNRQYRSMQAQAREILGRAYANPASDIDSLYQNKLRLHSEKVRAMGGVEKHGEGIRVFVTNKGFEGMPKEDIQKLIAAGFDVSFENVFESPAGYYVDLYPKSFSQIKHEVGDDWNAFEQAAQMRVAWERWDKFKHEYPHRLDYLPPDKMKQIADDAFAAHPEWENSFKDLQRFMDQLLLVSVLGGETTVDEAIRIKNHWEDYLPLQRKIEDRGETRSKDIRPSFGIDSAHGSPLVFRGQEASIWNRVDRAYSAYYDNALLNGLWNWVNEIASDKKNKTVPYEVRKELQRLMVPLHMETSKAATLTVQEQMRIATGAMNRHMLTELGGNPDGLTDAEVSEAIENAGEDPIKPEDINFAMPGFTVWRAKAPRGRNVVALWRDGQRQFFWIQDPLTFDLLTNNGAPNKWLNYLAKTLQGMTDPWKRTITHTLGFLVRNVVRDANTSSWLGEDTSFKASIPGFYITSAIIGKLTGNEYSLEAKQGTEMLTKSLDALSTDAHKSWLQHWGDMWLEGIRIPGFGSMSVGDQLSSIPGVLMSVVVKPIDVFNYGLPIGRGIGLRRLSESTEGLTREGHYKRARERGRTPMQAQAAYDVGSGNFGQRQAQSDLAAITRATGFLNPALQVMWQSWSTFLHPDAKVRAAKSFVALPTLATFAAIGSALSYLIMKSIHDDDELKELQENLRQRPEDEKLSNAAVFGKFRMPFDNGLVGAVQSYAWNSVEDYILKTDVDQEERAWKVLKQAADMPGFGEFIAPHPKVAIELWRNNSFYFDKEIVPHLLLQAHPNNPELQYFHDTPQLYQDIGKKLKVSPLKVQYAVRNGYAAVIDDTLKWMSDRSTGKSGWGDDPIFRRLMVREAPVFHRRSVQSLMDLDRDYDAVMSRLKNVRQLHLTTQEEDEARAMARQLSSAHAIANVIQKQWDAIKQERAKDNPDWTVIRRLERRMVETAAKYFRDAPPATE